MSSTLSEVPDLWRDYGLRVNALREHPGGFDSDCLVADGRWFVKIWRTRTAPTRLELLGELRAAGLPVPVPIPTTSGGPYAWWQGRPYGVFPYVAGRTANDDDDWRVTAQALKRVHDTHGIDLRRGSMDEPAIRWLGERLDHPWLRDRRHEVAEHIARLDRAIARARAKTVPQVLCHQDFGGTNLLLDGEAVAAIVDWENAVVGPREHDVWIAAEGHHGEQFLIEYGARDLDLDHIEYALLARALRDMAARVRTGTDRPGVDTWGFQRIARLESDLSMFRPFCV